MATDENPRITVSRDALRADLAEMELRLRAYFDAQLAHKADAIVVADIENRLREIERHGTTLTQTVQQQVEALRGRQFEVAEIRDQVVAVNKRLSYAAGAVAAIAVGAQALASYLGHA